MVWGMTMLFPAMLRKKSAGDSIAALDAAITAHTPAGPLGWLNR
jgi:hypothetical protein